MKGNWFNAFRASHSLEFGERDYAGWAEMVEQALPFYLKFLPAGSRVLECCCGLGCTAIPLSHRYKVTAFDRDDRILEYTIKNAAKFGGDIKILQADFRDIDRFFGVDSFDACSSGGVLEHYPLKEVRELVDKQLFVAPLVFASVPLGDGRKTVDEYGITRYNYTKNQWTDEILKDYNVIYKNVFRGHRKVAQGKEFKELFLVVKRK
jgi:hypothetical protein